MACSKKQKLCIFLFCLLQISFYAKIKHKIFGIKSLGCHDMNKLNITQFDIVNLLKIKKKRYRQPIEKVRLIREISLN